MPVRNVHLTPFAARPCPWEATATRIFVLDGDWPLNECDVEPTVSPCYHQVKCAQLGYREVL